MKLLNVGIRGGTFVQILMIDILLHHLESLAKFPLIVMIQDQTSGQQAL